MKIYVDNTIIVEEPDAEIKKWCNEYLVLDNPDYYKKVQMGKSTYNTPSKIYLYEKRGSDLHLPFGCLDNLWKALGRTVRFESRIKPIQTFSYHSGINLYPYQEKAVKKALTVKNGILVMPCGAGKTQTALELIARLGCKTLWLTHTQDLLNQSLNRAKAVYNYTNANTFGTITGGKVNISSGITFATVQTMAKLDLEKYKDEWSCIIVDECQHCAGSPTRVTQFYKVVNSLSCRYKFGLTATPKRADGLERSIFALLGNTIHEVSKEEVKDTTCHVKVEVVPTMYQPDLNVVLAGDGTLNYASLIDDLTHNDARLLQVSNHINSLTGPIIVLANRVEYLETLNKMYEGRSECLSGKSNNYAMKAFRKKALKMLDNNEIDCIFATYQLAKEGLDVPHLKYVVFATPEKDEVTVTQAAGRVGRKAEGKDIGTVIDFVDNFGMLQGYFKKRKRFYKKLEYEVVE